MISYQFTSAFFGVALAITILGLIRRDHLHSRHAAWWLIVAVSVMLLGFFPMWINPLAAALGISYPPTLLFLLGMGLLLMKVLMTDIHQSHLERKCRRLTQKVALLEAELKQHTETSHKQQDG